MPFGEKGHPLEGADADGSVGIDRHRVFPSGRVQADLTESIPAARSSAAVSIRFIRIIAVEGALGAGGISVADEPRELPRLNLPGEAIAIRRPSRTARPQARPIVRRSGGRPRPASQLESGTKPPH